jgi:hypothetical protein
MNIRELADQAGLDWHRGWTLDDNEPNRFSVFALLVAAHEREECAKLFDNHNIWDEECAAAIRARGKA